MRSIARATTALRNSPLLSALSITTIGFSLFAFGLFGLVALNIRSALEQVAAREEIRAFVADSTPIETLTAMAGEVQKFREVQKVDLVSQTEALARARQEMPEFTDVFQSDVLPASLDIHLAPGYRDPATVAKVADRIRNSYGFVDDVRYGEDWITQLYKLRNIAGIAGATLGLAFATVAIIIIGATIRMAILSRAREISIMRLVGATDGFIRRPFLIEGFVKGALGGALALLLTWGVMRALQQYLHFETVFFDRRTAALGVVAGAAIGLLGSAASVGRHLRRV